MKNKFRDYESLFLVLPLSPSLHSHRHHFYKDSQNGQDYFQDFTTEAILR